MSEVDRNVNKLAGSKISAWPPFWVKMLEYKHNKPLKKVKMTILEDDSILVKPIFG